ncbi:DNA-binding transcriptional regulator LsrR (DeoR family) [Amycolatopsis bartoniae]|uniref:DeoR family transcriptional regulator n=1 Tax=Amycolatopsis bartoniae TaxID=941986 RepID=A0A8H9J0B9_9PSEU|nr:sugar-binding domain-containing protein [Amycolatopsis bartoniae]MBB2937423.1 DNA-binding transcriptional regulator LsrR (DeoR family) [Amycolatopsis bartoniae]TVS99679.1 transcriptional regulator [Amycolatopsis bartoniae]GHF86679.1 DeoR family transcriptional regulator [Amycolatopsis bartoniae]
MSVKRNLADTMTSAVIAHRFYVDGRSKIEIAEEFGISRFKVARVLDWARDSGLVRIDFDLPVPVDVKLSDEVRAAYGLDQCFVLDRGASEGERPEVRRRIGAVAARLLSEIVTENDVLGLSWARSVNVTTEAVRRLPKCPVVQLCGVQAGIDSRDRSVETVARLASTSGGDAYPIYGPLVLPDRRTTEILRRQPGIAETFGQFKNLTKAVVSIGAWLPGESTVYDAVHPDERAAIAARGAKAEVAARLFDGEGKPMDTGLAHHVLAISTEELLRVPEVIALGYTAPKAEAIDAVLRSGLVSTLITDTPAAERLPRLVSA